MLGIAVSAALATAAVALYLVLVRDESEPARGELIAYSCKEPKNPWWAICTIRTDGTETRRLTKHLLTSDPAWSPDGRKIAFASNRRSHGYQIFVMDADGANVRLIANTEGRGTAPRWSPDGKMMYFTNCVEKDYGTDCEILMVRSEPQPIGK